MTELILALDVGSRKDAVDIAHRVAPYVDGIKIGYPLILAEGLDIVSDLSGIGVALIADVKVADIPNTNRLIAAAIFSAGFSAIITHGFTGRDSVEVCVDVAHDAGGECYVVAEMSHPGATEFFHGGVAERLAHLAVNCNADGIIAPATRPHRISLLRSIIGKKKILSPGIGAQGGDIDAVAELVDGVIIGRSIYDDPDPAARAREFAKIRR